MAVAALAGRRLDEAGAMAPRFPRSSIASVRKQIETVLVSEGIDLLVSSAASGADLIALEIAVHLGIRCRVVLPFEPVQFRETSVVDRSSDWGPIYDKVITRVSEASDLIVLPPTGKADGDSYARATEVIIAQAKQAAQPDPGFAILIWDGQSRGNDDFAEQFFKLAFSEGMKLRVILTL